jgi:ribosomal protein S18 acetylase RimI-like enzyme
VELTTDARDRRVRRIVPTAAGHAERLELDRRSDALAESLLDPLDAHERTRLVAAMGEVERLTVRSRTTIELAAPNSPDVRRCFDRYVAELQVRFESGFDVTQSNRMDMVDLTPPRGLVLLARMGDDAVGCGALLFLPDGVAELKRVWIAPRVRGMGLGRRMLRALEVHARHHDARVARLETNRSLTEAVAMYRADGYREVPAFNDEPYADHWFEKPLLG